LWPVTLRDMRRDDLPAVLDIERRSFSQPWSRAFFEKELATPFARLIVAVEAGRAGPTVVGYTCRWRVTDEVHVLNVAVHPDQRGRGFGRLLLEGTRGEARSSRARIVYLDVRAGARQAAAAAAREPRRDAERDRTPEHRRRGVPARQAPGAARRRGARRRQLLGRQRRRIRRVCRPARRRPGHRRARAECLEPEPPRVGTDPRHGCGGARGHRPGRPAARTAPALGEALA